MPSAQPAPMDLLARPDRTFEVLLFTLPGTRYGLEERWFNIGPFAERIDAQDEYDLLCREFREEALVVLLLVASVHDNASGLYRDRILESRGRAPLIRRERMASLSAQERKRLVTATAPYRRVPRAIGGSPAPRAPRRWGVVAGWCCVPLLLWLLLWGLAGLAPG